MDPKVHYSVTLHDAAAAVSCLIIRNNYACTAQARRFSVKRRHRCIVHCHIRFAASHLPYGYVHTCICGRCKHCFLPPTKNCSLIVPLCSVLCINRSSVFRKLKYISLISKVSVINMVLNLMKKNPLMIDDG